MRLYKHNIMMHAKAQQSFQMHNSIHTMPHLVIIQDVLQVMACIRIALKFKLQKLCYTFWSVA